jgi:hypothetical protein
MYLNLPKAWVFIGFLQFTSICPFRCESCLEMRSLILIPLLLSLNFIGAPLSAQETQPTKPRSARSDDDPLVLPANAPTNIQNRPIYPIEALSMRQELQDLLGRVDSAFNRAKADPTNTQRNFTGQSQAIASAQEFLKAMPNLIQAGRYGEVRQSWQQIRQGLWKDYPTEPLAALPEVRAIWLDRGTIVAAGSEQGLTLLMRAIPSTPVK